MSDHDLSQRQSVQARLPMPASASVQPDIWRLLTDAIYPTASSEAILLAIDYCRVRGLDVIKKPVHIVTVWNAALGKNAETIFPSIQELQTTASRTGSWAGMDSPKWGPLVSRTFRGGAWVKNAVGREEWVADIEESVEFPEWCEVTIYRMVDGAARAFSEPVYWLEAYSTTARNSELPTEMWVKRPRGQLHKCAKAAALRAAFPEECGYYAAEEMEGKTIGDDARVKPAGQGPADSGTPTADGAHPRDADVPPDNGDKPNRSGHSNKEQDKANRIKGLIRDLYSRTPPDIDESKLDPQIVTLGKKFVRRCLREACWETAAEYIFTNPEKKFSGEARTYLLSVLVKARQSIPDRQAA